MKKQLFRRHWQKISPSVWLFVLALVLVYAFIPSEYLDYNLSAIGKGEYWRLISASISHFSWMHLLLNISGFLLLVFIFPDYFSTSKWLVHLMIIALLTNLIILVVYTDTVEFSGLSGALHGLIYSVARANIRQLTGQLLLVLLVVKLAIEQFYGESFTVDLLEDYPVFYASHFFGVFASILTLLLERRTRLGN